MRDYDPTTGRYIQTDPLGLGDGASVYGYARQNPGRYVDPRGEFTMDDAAKSLAKKGVSIPAGHRRYSTEQIFDEWLELERANEGWLGEIPNCPCIVDPSEEFVAGDQWAPLDSTGAVVNYFHGPKAQFELRSWPSPNGYGNQCMYDQSGNLIRTAPDAGSADYYSPNGSLWGHWAHDVHPYTIAEKIGRIDDYYNVRPVR